MPGANPDVSRHYGGQFVRFLSTSWGSCPPSEGRPTGKCTLQPDGGRWVQGYIVARPGGSTQDHGRTKAPDTGSGAFVMWLAE